MVWDLFLCKICRDLKWIRVEPDVTVEQVDRMVFKIFVIIEKQKVNIEKQ